MFSWLSSKAETRISNVSGRGTFANATINKDEVIAIFGGYILDTETWKNTGDEELGSLALPLDEEFVIGPKSIQETGDGDFINHSCKPNAGIYGQIMLVAMHEITVGEEITFDYAMVLAGISDEDCSIKCQCNTSNCRKIITGNDWKDKKLQEHYKGYFSQYIQKKIEKNK